MSEKTTGTVYVDKKLWAAAKKKGINISQLLRDELRKLLEEDRCETCGMRKSKKLIKK